MKPWLALLLLLSACSFRQEKKQADNLEATFVSIQSQIFQPKCMQCHSSSEKKGGVDLSNLEIILADGLVISGSPETSPLFISINNGSMPKNAPPLSANEIAIIRNWILKEGSSSIVPITEPPNEPVFINFSLLSSRVLLPRCARCHNPSNEEAFVDVTNREALLNNAFISNLIIPGNAEMSLLYQVVKDGSMPRPRAAPRLSEEELELLFQWIQNGALP